MRKSRQPPSDESRAIAASVETDFRALVEIFSRDVADEELASQMQSAREAAKLGMRLAERLRADLDLLQNLEDVESASDPPQTWTGRLKRELKRLITKNQND